mgnify:FL=1
METQQLVTIVPWTFIATILNLFLQLYLIKRFLFKPVQEGIRKRQGKADQDIRQERRKALNELKGEIGGIAMDIAGKVVEKEIDEKDHRSLIEDFLKNVEEAS